MKTLAASCGDGSFQLIIGADVVYWPAPLPLLLETIQQLSGPTTTVAIAHTPRGHQVARATAAAFFEELADSFEAHVELPAGTLAVSWLRDTKPEIAAKAGLSRGGDFSEVGSGSIHVYSRLRCPRGVSRKR